MGSFLLGIGIDILKGYLGDLFEFVTDQIIGWVDDLTKKYGEKDVLSSLPDIYNSIYNNIINNFDLIIEQNNINYEDTQIFKNFNKDVVIIEINKIIQDLNYENEIKQKAKKVFVENSQIGKDFGLLNILLNGDDKNISKFIEIFNINKNNKSEYYFNNEANGKNEIIEKNEIKVLQNKIKQIKLYDKKNVNNNNIDWIWEFIEEGKTNITNTPNTPNTPNTHNATNSNDTPSSINTPNITNKPDNIPIIYIYFRDDLEITKIYAFSDLNSSVEYLNYKILFTNYIIDVGKNGTCNDSEKKYLFDLFEKTVLNIIINKYEKGVENKSNEIKNSLISNRNFSFGNEIDNLYIMNLQIVQSIFKKFLGKRIPDTIKNVIKGYQDKISKTKNSFLSDIFYKVIPLIKKILYTQKQLIVKDTNYGDNKRKLKIDIIDKTISLIDELDYIDDSEENSKGKIIKVKSMKIDNINKIIKTKLEDYFLRKASLFINELIIDTIKETIMDLYNIRIITNYFKNHDYELVFIDCKEIK